MLLRTETFFLQLHHDKLTAFHFVYTFLTHQLEVPIQLFRRLTNLIRQQGESEKSRSPVGLYIYIAEVSTFLSFHLPFAFKQESLIV